MKASESSGTVCLVPSASVKGMSVTDVDDRVLERVRKLLTRAEHPATPPAEAEACSAKEAALMSRHLIDRAMVDAGRCDRDKPVVRRVVVEPPYTVGKVVLLDEVAKAFGIPVAIGRGHYSSTRRCTLVGFAGDLAMVELLFTSLLLQASTAMRAASARPDVKAYRRAFLFGYASSIGARLTAVRRETVREATSTTPGTDLVLVDRQTQVDAAFQHEFPTLGTFRATASSGSGFVAGRDAGGRADLSARQTGLRNRRGQISA
jgi:hypothetical protein